MEGILIWVKKYARYFLVCWLLIIIVVSSLPSVPVLKIHTEKNEIRLDYLFHFGEYGILAFLTFLSFTGEKFKMSWKKYILITAALILFAILDEAHQKLIPGRSFNIMDIMSNVAGIVGALIFCVFFFRKIYSHK
jgi:VanZ family protein